MEFIPETRRAHQAIYDKFEDAKRIMRNRKSKKAENSTAKRKREKGQNTSQKTKN
jgi:hypothetical protein